MLGNARPTRASLVKTALPVPVKLNLHAAVFVRVYLLTRGPDNSCCLTRQDHRLWGHTGRSKWNCFLAPWNTLAIIQIAAVLHIRVIHRKLRSNVSNLGNDVASVHILVGIIEKLELMTRCE